MEFLFHKIMSSVPKFAAEHRDMIRLHQTSEQLKNSLILTQKVPADPKTGYF